jgi:hypothetical protein
MSQKGRKAQSDAHLFLNRAFFALVRNLVLVLVIISSPFILLHRPFVLPIALNHTRCSTAHTCFPLH